MHASGRSLCECQVTPHRKCPSPGPNKQKAKVQKGQLAVIMKFKGSASLSLCLEKSHRRKGTYLFLAVVDAVDCPFVLDDERFPADHEMLIQGHRRVNHDSVNDKKRNVILMNLKFLQDSYVSILDLGLPDFKPRSTEQIKKSYQN